MLYSIAFLSGFAVMGYEILGTRVLFPYYGSSVYVLGAIISVFLAGLGIGYAVGGRIADSNSGANHLSGIIFFPTILVLSFPLYGYRFCEFFYALNLESRVGALLLSVVIFLPPCVFLGAVIPIIVKIVAINSGRIGRAAGMYMPYRRGKHRGNTFHLLFPDQLDECFKGDDLYRIRARSRLDIVHSQGSNSESATSTLSL